MRRPFFYLIIAAVLVWWVSTIQPAENPIPDPPPSPRQEVLLPPSTLKAAP